MLNDMIYLMIYIYDMKCLIVYGMIYGMSCEMIYDTRYDMFCKVTSVICDVT